MMTTTSAIVYAFLGPLLEERLLLALLRHRLLGAATGEEVAGTVAGMADMALTKKTRPKTST
eukprot:6502382-Prorocentrum_lima.AAC.1